MNLSDTLENHPEFLSSIFLSTTEGIVACDCDGKLIYENPQCIQMFSQESQPVPLHSWQDFYDVFHSDGKTLLQYEELPLYRALHDEIVTGCEIIVTHKRTGISKYVICNARPVHNNEGKKLGAVILLHDITQSKISRTLADLNHALAQSEQRFRTIFEQSPLSIQLLNKNGKTLLVNSAYKELWGITDEFVENVILTQYNILEDPILDQKGLLPLFRKAFAGEIVQVKEFLYDPMTVGSPGRPRWAKGIIYPLKNSAGEVQEVVIIHQDVTDIHKHESGLNFLAYVKSLLLSTTDYDQILEHVATATIPYFADGCLIDILEGSSIRRIVIKHTDKEVQKLLEELDSKFPIEIDSPQLSATAIRTGKAQFIEKLYIDELIKNATSDQHIDIIKKLNPKSHIAIPLKIRGEVIGAINLLISSPRALFDDKDFNIAMELGKHVSVTIDNARLFKEKNKAIELRDDFISIASHELRTPITSLNLQIRVLEDLIQNFNEKDNNTLLMKKFIKSTNGQLARLTRLVDDMLDISRINTGKLTIKPQKTNLTQLVYEVLERFEDQFQGHKIEVQFKPTENLEVSCDVDRMEQVITNFVTNSIRYGNNTPIHLDLYRNEKRVVFSIRDFGRGIAKSDQKRIFDRFERSDDSDSSGLGLGLFINNQIIQEHGGSITVESEPGKGSKFIMELPY